MKRLIFFIIISILLFLIGLKFIPRDKKTNCIETTGVIEAAEVELSSKISGRIDWLCCKEGDAIKAGDIAARLDDKELKIRVDEGMAVLKGAEIFVKTAESNLENAKIGREDAISEVEAAEAGVKRINILTQESKKNVKRASQLFKDSLISERDMDAAQAVYDVNYAQLNIAKAHKKTADVKLKMAVINIKTALSQLSSAIAKVQELQARLSLLETQLKDIEVISPIDGVIVYKVFEQGELAGSGAPIYTVHNLKNIWARINIEETMIGRIKLFDMVKVTAMGIRNKEFDGKVIEIGRAGEFATQRDVTRGRSDIRTFRIKIGIDKPEGLLKSGMTVKVKMSCQ